MMRQVIVIPEAVLPYLISTTESELSRQRQVHEKLAEESWPADFDAHDILMFDDVLEQLRTASNTGGGNLSIPYSKGMQLLMRLVQNDDASDIAVVEER